MSVSYKPDQYPNVSPFLVVKDPAKSMAFVEKVFDAKVRPAMRNDEGGVEHGEVEIGDSLIMFGPSRGEYAPRGTMLYVYVPDADATYQKALAAGAESLREPVEQFYGDRSGGFKDSDGNEWWVATRVKEMTAEDMEAAKEQYGKS